MLSEGLKSIVIRIFGWIALIIGGIGTFSLGLFVLSFISCLCRIRPDSDAGGSGMLLGFLLGFIFLSLPCPWILRLGIRILQGKPVGIKIIRWSLRLVSIVVGVLLLIQLNGLFGDLMSGDDTRLSMWTEYIAFSFFLCIILILPLILLKRHQIEAKE